MVVGSMGFSLLLVVKILFGWVWFGVDCGNVLALIYDEVELDFGCVSNVADKSMVRKYE